MPGRHHAKTIDYGDGPECRICGEPTTPDGTHSDPNLDASVPALGRPLARSDDPHSAREAAVLVEPRRTSAKGRVLALLRSRRGDWIDAVEFTRPDVGGFAGTRRLRELRDEGWPVETRREPGSLTTWQHRLPPHEQQALT